MSESLRRMGDRDPGRVAAQQRPPEAAPDAQDAPLTRAQAEALAKRQNAILAVAVLVIGGLCTAVGIGLWVGASVNYTAGIGAGAATFGILVFVVGILIGLN